MELHESCLTHKSTQIHESTSGIEGYDQRTLELAVSNEPLYMKQDYTITTVHQYREIDRQTDPYIIDIINIIDIIDIIEVPNSLISLIFD